MCPVAPQTTVIQVRGPWAEAIGALTFCTRGQSGLWLPKTSERAADMGGRTQASVPGSREHGEAPIASAQGPLT